MVNVLALTCLLTPLQQQATVPQDVAKILPPSTVVVLEMPAPLAFVNSVLEHPIHARAQKDSVLAAAYKSPKLAAAKAGVVFAETALKMKWPDAVTALAGEGITVGYDAGSEAAVAVLKSGDPEKLATLVEKLLEIAKNQRQANNQGAIESGEYRGVTVHRVDNIALAILPNAVLVATDKKLGKWVLDAAIDQPAETLAKNTAYAKALAGKDKTDSISAFVDMEEVRKRGGLEQLLEGTRSNVLAEFLLGGVFESLNSSPFITAGLRLNEDSLRLEARTPHDPSAVSEPREFYFGPEGTGRAPAMIPVDSTIANISTYRDVSKMWLYAGDLFDQKVNDGFAEAETGLSTLFAGKDFAEEILAEIKPGWQLVVAREDFSNVLPRPAVQFPSFALVGELKDTEKMNSELKRTFQSMVGFFNVVGAMEGNPQLEQDMETENGVKYLTASFVPTPEDKESTEATIHYNFTPSLALGKDRFALASSLSLAKKAMGAAAQPAVADRNQEAANFDLNLKAETLRKILDDNKKHLISNNMLEEGNTREAAEAQINLLLGIVGWFEDFNATLTPTANQLKLQLQLSLRK